VGGPTLIVGIDLAREHQAISFAEGAEIVGRLRVGCSPQRLAVLLPRAESIRLRRHLERAVFALEPAGHYWCLAAESSNARGCRTCWLGQPRLSYLAIRDARFRAISNAFCSAGRMT
jgi:hypothetical protein